MNHRKRARDGLIPGAVSLALHGVHELVEAHVKQALLRRGTREHGGAVTEGFSRQRRAGRDGVLWGGRLGRRVHVAHEDIVEALRRGAPARVALRRSRLRGRCGLCGGQLWRRRLLRRGVRLCVFHEGVTVVRRAQDGVRATREALNPHVRRRRSPVAAFVLRHAWRRAPGRDGSACRPRPRSIRRPRCPRQIPGRWGATAPRAVPGLAEGGPCRKTRRPGCRPRRPPGRHLTRHLAVHLKLGHLRFGSP